MLDIFSVVLQICPTLNKVVFINKFIGQNYLFIYRRLSTDITCKRLQVLNKKSRQKISLFITDLKDEKGNSKGTRVTFDIPYKS